MSVTDLISQFSSRTSLSVDVNDVVEFIKRCGHQDRIEFIPVDYNTDIILGNYQNWVHRPVAYGEPYFCVDIYYDQNQSVDWQRFVCCKELLHVFDPDAGRAGTPEQVADLMGRIGLPPEMQDALEEGYATMLDRIREYQALAVLFPIAARNLLISRFESGNLSIEAIARLADIPAKYVSLAMDPRWPRLHDRLVTLGRTHP